MNMQSPNQGEFTPVIVSAVALIGGGYLASIARQEDRAQREKQRSMNT